MRTCGYCPHRCCAAARCRRASTWAAAALAASAVGDADAFDGMARNLDAWCAPNVAASEAAMTDAPPRYLLRSVMRCGLVAAQPFLPFSSQ